jgi:hypothetical protein
MSFIALILSGLASILQCDTRKPSSFPEGTLPWVDLELDLLQVVECLPQITNEASPVLCPDHDVINVGLYVTAHLWTQAIPHHLWRVVAAFINPKGIPI